MKLLSTLACFCALLCAVSARAENVDWRAPGQPLALSYDTALWAPTDARPKAMPDVSFVLKHKDQKTVVFVRIGKFAPGEKLDDKTLELFATGVSRGSEKAGQKSVVEWTRKDFVGDAGCEFKINSPVPQRLFSGRLMAKDGTLFQIMAHTDGGSPEAFANAQQLMRAFKFR